jgi:protein arginine kinase activator
MAGRLVREKSVVFTSDFPLKVIFLEMANSLKCNLCNNLASVHLTQILNNKIHKVDLCESCAQAKGVTDPNGFSLADLLVKNPLEAEKPSSLLKCPVCGFTQNDFRKLGRLGCPSCYKVFDPLLSPVLENMHKGSLHRGKIPEKAVARRSVQERLDLLEEEINAAIESERYEDAARIRDEINKLKEGAPKGAENRS